MPSAKTECSELSVAFGILGISNPINLDKNNITELFSKTLSIDKYIRFQSEFQKNLDLYSRLHKVGESLRRNHALIAQTSSVQWTGPQKQAATTSTAKDLLAVNIPISVKTASNVVSNPSPYNLLVSSPQGSAQASNTTNWYLQTDLPGFQNLYSFVCKRVSEDFPYNVRDFEKRASGHDRKYLRDAIKNFSVEDTQGFIKRYIDMCHNVAIKSSNIFNDHLIKSLESQTRNAVLESIAKLFFRMDSVEYILCGIDGSKDLSVIIPDLTSWKKGWEIKAIYSEPDLNRKQSVVNFIVEFVRKSDKSINLLNFHAEIRWSHGRFSSVEGKLYKDFFWRDVPFFKRIT